MKTGELTILILGWVFDRLVEKVKQDPERLKAKARELIAQGHKVLEKADEVIFQL